jgi:hypothetical protein
VPQGTLTVRLEVQGEPQHAIAFADFTKLAEDYATGEFDWRKAIFTLSVLSPWHTEARWPQPARTYDAVRLKVIYAGDQYYLHYVAPQTVVGLTADGYLVTSDGGWIPAKVNAAYPIPYLEDVAKISAAWYTVQHYVLTLESYRLKAAVDIPLGGLIVNAGGGVVEPGHRQEVNSPITQIRMVFPRGGGDKTPPARMQIKTWAGELEAVEFVAVKLPATPVVAAGGPAPGARA